MSAPDSQTSPEILLRDDQLWVLSKPAGWAVHGARGLDGPDLVSWLRAQLGDRAGLSATSGSFSNYLSKLRTNGLLVGRDPVKAAPELFGTDSQ